MSPYVALLAPIGANRELVNKSGLVLPIPTLQAPRKYQEAGKKSELMDLPQSESKAMTLCGLGVPTDGASAVSVYPEELGLELDTL
jgi:hypothetical protein